ncbi:VWA domain-containing protein [Aurantibacillus circumpalustris]|uniref:VWA domain-containing protein n=1 Tax=Aurantibacillus circumpalustris TaxID=3036359 RepID=UPI00295B43AD|nr:VWA domain-containing protein [Aurantibacillus circumpalustris]
MIKLFYFLLFLPLFSISQISFSEQYIDLGNIKEAYEIKGDVVLTNTSSKKIFLMRADADQGVKIYTTKKTLLPNDTCLLVISFIPEHNGKFKKKINLVSTDKETPYELTLAGNIATVKTNDKMACVYFGKRKTNPVSINEEPIVIPNTPVKRDNSNKLPRSSEPLIITGTPKPELPLKEVVIDKFSKENYKPNNILFLLDISSSMRDSLKLPIMKTALHRLIDAARDIDTISLVTYASKVNLLSEAICGTNKQNLHTLVDSLKAKGMTSGRTAILFSQLLSQKHFIEEGNNQIIMASDGEFKFERDDFLTWKKRQQEKKIIITTVAFGEDKTALRNLKDIANKGEGSFIHLNQKSGSEETLLEEIKLRSKK